MYCTVDYDVQCKLYMKYEYIYEYKKYSMSWRACFCQQSAR